MGQMKDRAIQQEEAAVELVTIARRDCPQPGCRGDGTYLDRTRTATDIPCPICTQVGEKLREVARVMPSWTEAYEALFM